MIVFNVLSVLAINDSLTVFTGESDDRAKTRERFNEVFKKYTEPEKKKVKKKKKAETQETIIVCVLISLNI